MYGSGYYEAVIKQKYPELQYDFMYFNECSDHIQRLLRYYPFLSSSGVKRKKKQKQRTRLIT